MRNQSVEKQVFDVVEENSGLALLLERYAGGRMKLSTNLWLGLSLISIFATIMIAVLGGLVALATFRDIVRQGSAKDMLDAWWQVQKHGRTHPSRRC